MEGELIKHYCRIFSYLSFGASSIGYELLMISFLCSAFNCTFLVLFIQLSILFYYYDCFFFNNGGHSIASSLCNHSIDLINMPVTMRSMTKRSVVSSVSSTLIQCIKPQSSSTNAFLVPSVVEMSRYLMNHWFLVMAFRLCVCRIWKFHIIKIWKTHLLHRETHFLQIVK